MEITNYLDNVYNEVEVWAQCSHPNIIKLYEIIDAEEHDYLYLILELADLGQLAKWDFENECYIRNEKIINCILAMLEENGQMLPLDQSSDIEQCARYIFYKLA
jgi:serine/threonine protein kinase